VRHLGQVEFLVESERIAGNVTVSGSGRTVFAYGSTASRLQAVDGTLRKALIADGRTATIRAERWEQECNSWQDFDPVLTPGYEPTAVAPTPHSASSRAHSSAAQADLSAALTSATSRPLQTSAGSNATSSPTPGLFRTRREITLTGSEEQV
jgi:hypothetical protein